MLKIEKLSYLSASIFLIFSCTPTPNNQDDAKNEKLINTSSKKDYVNKNCEFEKFRGFFLRFDFIEKNMSLLKDLEIDTSDVENLYDETSESQKELLERSKNEERDKQTLRRYSKNYTLLEGGLNFNQQPSRLLVTIKKAVNKFGEIKGKEKLGKFAFEFENGKLVGMKYKCPQGHLVYKHTKNYINNNLKREMMLYSGDTSKLNKYAHKKDGTKLLKEMSFVHGKKDTFDRRRTTFTSFGKRKTVVEFGNNGDISNKFIYYYNKNNDVIKKETYGSDGELVDRKKYKDDGLPKSRIKIESEARREIIRKRNRNICKNYSYKIINKDSLGNWQKVVRLERNCDKNGIGGPEPLRASYILNKKVFY